MARYSRVVWEKGLLEMGKPGPWKDHSLDDGVLTRLAKWKAHIVD